MISRVKEMVKKISKNKKITLRDGWQDPSKALPNLNYPVQVIVKSGGYFHDSSIYYMLTTAIFDPHRGWGMSDMVVAWKETDFTLQNFLDLKS